MSQTTPSERSFWFQAVINRNGVAIPRQGTVKAAYAYQAMNEIKIMAEKEWKQPYMSVAIYHLTEHGEVGTLIMKTGNSGGVTKYRDKRHTCDATPKPAPYEFGTYYAKKNYPVFSPKET